MIFKKTFNQRFAPTTVHLEQTREKTSLLRHDLQVLKGLFYAQLNINVPKDIMEDIDYARVNISQILSYFNLKIWANQIIKLDEQVKTCKFCEERYYFKSAKWGVCVSCYVKEIEGMRTLEVQGCLR